MPARRFLAPAARQGDGHGYLTQPQRQYPIVADPPEVLERIADASRLCDEPEAPSADWVDAETEMAAERNRRRLLLQATHAREARGRVSMPNRLLDAERRAKVRRTDIRQELFVIRDLLKRGKQRDAVCRLERVEARLDGVYGLEGVV